MSARATYHHCIEVTARRELDVYTNDGNPKSAKEVCLELANYFEAAASGANHGVNILLHPNETYAPSHAAAVFAAATGGTGLGGITVGSGTYLLVDDVGTYSTAVEMTSELVATINAGVLDASNLYVMATNRVAKITCTQEPSNRLRVFGVTLTASANPVGEEQYSTTGLPDSIAATILAHPYLRHICAATIYGETYFHVSLLPWVDTAQLSDCEVVSDDTRITVSNGSLAEGSDIAIAAKVTGPHNNYVPVGVSGEGFSLYGEGSTLTNGQGRYGVQTRTVLL